MKIIKQVDWQAKGIERVRWEIATVPDDMSIEDFISQKIREGWEVIGITEDVIGKPALFIEMDAKQYNEGQNGGDIWS